MRKNVEYVQDMSNFESVHDRNIIRNEMMAVVLKINPGIEKTVKKLLLKRHVEMI
jgi:tRNA(Ile)-lysidine synthase TilS/MesJ